MLERAKNLLTRFVPPFVNSPVKQAVSPDPLLQKRFERVIVRPREGSPEVLAGVQRACDEVIAIADLPKFSRTLQKNIVQDNYRESICPIQVIHDGHADKRYFAIVLLRDMLQTDVTEEAITALSHDFQPANPCIYIATQNVLSELASVIHDPQSAQRLTSEHESTLWKRFVEWVEFALAHDASDLHIRLRTHSPYSQVSFRMDGSAARPRRFRISTKQLIQVMSYLYSFHGNSTTTNYFNPTQALECQLEETICGKRLAFRWGQLPVHGGAKIVLRMIRLDSSDAFTSLGREPGGAGFTAHQVAIWERNLYSAGGATLLAGVVNSGKSKTVHTVLSLLPSDVEINTAEDPIENPLQHEGANQHSTSRAMGDDASKDPFNAFKLMNKRMDPDVTFIGELRDSKTASAFRDAVLSGQRVFSTIHANDALTIPERLASEEFGLTREVITLPHFLKLLVYQALVPRNCPHCALPVAAADTAKQLKARVLTPDIDPVVAHLASTALRIVSADRLNRIEQLFAFDPTRMRVRNPTGCSHCIRENVPELNGVRGRALVAQMIEPTLDMLALIRDAKTIESHRLYQSLRVAGFDSDNTDGKTPMQIAMFNVSLGEVCLSEVEKRFQSIDAYEYQMAQFDTRTIAPADSRSQATAL